MSTLTKTLLLFALSLSAASAAPAGAAAGMDLDLIKNIKNYVMPTILHDINTLQLPRIEYKGGYVDNLAFQFNLASNDSVQFSFDPAQNAVVLTAQNIFGQITGNFKQRLLLISATGKFKAAFKDGGISLKVVVPLHSQLVDGKLLPKVEVTTFNIAFDTKKIVISIWGGFLADIGDLFIGLFKGTIIKSIGNGINQNVGPKLNTSIQSLILASNGVLPLYKGISMDIQFPADPLVTSQSLGLYLNATIFNASNGYRVPDSVIQDVSLNFTSSNQILIDTSRWVTDSVLDLVQQTGILDILIDQEMLGPVYGPQFLNTSFGDGVFPGLNAKYGRNQPMSLRIFTSKAPTSFFHVGQLGIETTFDIDVFVRDQLAVSIRVINADGSISVALDKGTLSFQILELYMNDAVVLSSEIGDIPIWDLKTFINFAIKLGLPYMNGFLNRGIPLPDTYFDLVRIKDASFTAMEGYVQVGIVPEFI
ncbi:hypothetical protein FGO68_gene12198 [Halteria grandinella]|uniref:Lipid-binding serum glycoprotein C-terminal domain-containing protein n=1 Tax=Halteria grandinella TaxID=5974 RepID=A0A8J8NPW5_HALGN|nr:hypothetical protein FGO68_gene12198 [Halteria grandinella]